MQARDFRHRLSHERPEDARLFWITQDKPFADPKAAIDWEIKIFAEDQKMVESQHPEELPLDLGEEFHIRADQMSISYRRGLAALGLKGEMTS